jgi:hypothetical protein
MAVLFAGVAAHAAKPCDEAWASYRQFKSRTVMEESQYTLTTQAAAVRAACGKEALPAPPGADTPHRLLIRKPLPPTPPAPPKAPVRSTTSAP